MFAILRNLWGRRRLLKDFVVRDLKARYVGSSMGFFWSVVFPILNLFVYMFVFRLVLNTRWSDVQGAGEVALVMLAGIVVWTAFAETVSRSTNCLVDNANLIKKVVFPSELLPAFLTISSLVNMCIGLPVVLIAVLWMTHVSPPEVFLYVKHDLVDDPESDDPEKLIKVINQDLLALPEGGDLQLQIQLSQAQSRDTTVRLRAAPEEGPNGETGAVEGEDYWALPKEVLIPKGFVEVWVNIHARQDGVKGEGLEYFRVGLGSVEGLSLKETKPGHDHQVSALIRLHNVDLPEPLAENGVPPKPELDGLEPTPDWVPSEGNLDKHNDSPLKLGWALLFVPVLIGLQGVFTLGLAYFLSTLNVFLRDTFHLVGVGITVWMFGTPIFYPDWMVQEAGFGWMLNLNPMYWLIEAYRDVLLEDHWPQLWDVGRFAFAAVLMFFLGAKFFRSQHSKFPDLL